MSSDEFRVLLQQEWPELSLEAQKRAELFFDLVRKENEVQNLTRLISPADFIFGHVLDVRELLKSGLLSFPAMDLGSGCGVPGLLCALLADGNWVLAESEGHKAEFLERAAEECGLTGRVSVFKGRAEDYLKSNTVNCIVARAVGPVGRIFNWIKNCSTWNKLVLLKGPSWTSEWSEFLLSNDRKKLLIGNTYEYSVGPEKKSRVIVELNRK